MSESKIYYKYRSLQIFDRIVEIILNQELFASRYDKLNDPMEGYYYHQKFSKELTEYIKSEKEKCLILSLSENKDNNLLWAYYADSQQGVCFGVEINDNTVKKPQSVKYKGLKFLDNKVLQSKNLIENILIHKNKEWKAEKEYRVFSNSNKVKVKITEIILGHKVDSINKELIVDLVKKSGLDIEITQYQPHKEGNKFEIIFQKSTH